MYQGKQLAEYIHFFGTDLVCPHVSKYCRHHLYGKVFVEKLLLYLDYLVRSPNLSDRSVNSRPSPRSDNSRNSINSANNSGSNTPFIKNNIDFSNIDRIDEDIYEKLKGSFVETIKANVGGQVSFSNTKPGITRGNHFHTRKIERFAVIKGKAKIEMRKVGTNKILSFELNSDNPSFVDMPIWYTHNITNIGDEDLYTIFWINEFYNPEDPDTFFEKV